MEFNESTGQTEVLKHCAWLDKCIDQQPDKRHLASFISLSLYFLIPAPSQATQIFPFPCLWFLLSLFDNSLVQWQNASLCIPHWVSFLYRQFLHSAFKVAWRPSTLTGDDGCHSQPTGLTPSWDALRGGKLRDSFFCLSYLVSPVCCCASELLQMCGDEPFFNHKT